MASSSPSRSPIEQSFSYAAGEYTDAEKEYLLRKGLIYENSNEEILEISTDVESMNSSSLNKSRFDSLLIFEETERLYLTGELLNKSTTDGAGISPMKAQGSPAVLQISSKTPERSLVNVSRFNGSPLSPYQAYAEEEDKENVFKGPVTSRVLLFQKEEEKRDPLEEIKGIAEQSRLLIDFDASSEKSFDEATSQASTDDVCIVPCTQEVASCSQEDNAIQNSDFHEVDVVPATQVLNESLNLNQTYTSVTLEESLAEAENESVVLADLINLEQSLAQTEAEALLSNLVTLRQSMAQADTDAVVSDMVTLTLGQPLAEVENETEAAILEAEDYYEVLAPCTQAMCDTSFFSDEDISRLDISSIPCSQTSQVSSTAEASSQDPFNDTIAVMERLLAMADEQEEKEKLEAEAEKVQEDKSDALVSEPVSSHPEAEEAYFKTPLKHNRVQLLKNKKVASPSPPRSYANTLLQQRGTGVKPITTHNERKIPVVRKPANTKSPMSTSTPKRAPLSTITPTSKKIHTPGRGGVPKTPASAKVDSGLRSTDFPLGLSPVARYIYDKPAPSKFARVQGVPNQKAAGAFASNTSFSRIPLAPPRGSQVSSKQNTPASASKQPRHSVLRTSTYFNLAGTPPQVQIVANEKNLGEKKRFQPMQYTGAPKVKALNGKVDSPRLDKYIAHRHTGLRDESGNASLVQDTSIQKRNIPHQSRLCTPKSYICKNNDNNKNNKENQERPMAPRRERTFVVTTH